jgi:glycosyltransferase involved in cell wall biosynthesis
MKILFLAPYPLKLSPSQRFRFEQYFSLLTSHGYHFHVQTFLDSHNWQFFFNKGKSLAKILALARGFARRFLILFTLHRYDRVLIHREAAPLGPPVFEWLIAKVWRKKIIYDFDDAIWLTDRKSESWALRVLKWRTKVGSICKWSYRVSCGNAYLSEFARQFNSRVVFNPTTVDTDNLHLPRKFNNSNALVIGWTGSHSTLKYLKEVEPVLQSIEERFPNVNMLVIADKNPHLELARFDFKPWNPATETSDLAPIDIGIMPLPFDEWSKGKCGFKALQYMAMAIPTVASPVGVNTKIIDHNLNGFLANGADEWRESLIRLIEDSDLRARLGQAARLKVVQHYSVSSNSDNFLSLFTL